MKIRQGYVSNSSSSSFIIMKKDLTREQIISIFNHSSIAEKLMEQRTKINLEYFEDSWWINETDLTIEGNTYG